MLNRILLTTIFTIALTACGKNDTEENLVMCAADVKVCSDGTSVGRSGSMCEFICPASAK